MFGATKSMSLKCRNCFMLEIYVFVFENMNIFMTYPPVLTSPSFSYQAIKRSFFVASTIISILVICDLDRKNSIAAFTNDLPTIYQ